MSDQKPSDEELRAIQHDVFKSSLHSDDDREGAVNASRRALYNHGLSDAQRQGEEELLAVKHERDAYFNHWKATLAKLDNRYTCPDCRGTGKEPRRDT